jgi:hypothetical protein
VANPISVSGYLPLGRRLDAVVTRALKKRLQKLVDTEVTLKFLMIELPTTDSEIRVLEVIREIAGAIPGLAPLDSINEIVFAKTFGFESEGSIFFKSWNPRSGRWSEHLHATVEQPKAEIGDSAPITI